MQVTAGDVAAAVEGRLAVGDPDRPIAGFSIDSRRIAPGDLFFAIRGERFDGHAFVGDALGAGACGVVVSDPAAIPRADGAPAIAIEVADTTRALQALANRIRRASGARVVAITGSAGKTTTKEATAEMLSARYRVFRNAGNLNNHVGLPLSLLELRHGPEVAVVELGMNHAGEISTLVRIAEPEVRVWTNVAEVHTAFFPSLDAVADAKAEILERADAKSVLVANGDDPRVMGRVGRFPGRVLTFGLEVPADVSAANVRDLGLDGMAATVQTAQGAAPIRTPLLGRGNLSNILAATAVALTFEVPLDVIVRRGSALRPAPHRGEVIRLARGTVIVIDDSYNSNPRALEGALQVLGAEARAARRVAVLGEMLELGDQSEALHARSGRAAAAAGVEVLIAVGGRPAQALAAAAAGAGIPNEAVFHVSTSDEAAALALGIVRPGDLVLVKGSRGIRTDVVVTRLQAELA